MGIGSKIKAERIKLGLTQQEFAKKINQEFGTDVSNGMISKWENEKEAPSLQHISNLSEMLGVNVDYLIGTEEKNKIKKGIRINVYGSIPAGIPLEAIEDVADWEEIPEEWTKGNKKYIALKVKGDSMYPKYLEGDIIIILLQEDFESGQDVVAYVNGFEATLKTAIRNIGGSITLRPINPNYAPKTYGVNDDPVKVLGIVKQLRRSI